ncbi:hypothetical protein ABKV19_006002 [Rosa sericea]
MFQNSKTAESAFGAAIKVCSDRMGQFGMREDVDGNVPFFWGIDSEGNLVIADDAEVVKDRGKLFAPFPKGSLSTKRKLRENDRVVAEGKISSTNPSIKVHCVPLGQECWKVWVDVALDEYQTLEVYRATMDAKQLGEAVGSTLAWPKSSIKLLPY